MNFDDYSNQVASVLGPEKERFSDTLGTVTKARRVVVLTLLALFSIIAFIILISVAVSGESGSRFAIAGGGILGILVLDAVIILGMQSSGEPSTVGVHTRGIVVGAGDQFQRFLASELLECWEMEPDEVEQLETMAGNTGESMVILNTEQYFLGFSFKRNGMENCYVQPFQNRNTFQTALNACCQLIASSRPTTPEYRTWTAKTGYSIEAAFRKESNGMTLLACPNGQFVKVATDSLIDSDQMYCRNQ